ncbi:hypothetical protein EES45_22535 [Streptomyces sp. ADI97-07]|nr:hypothetical protein EES45_22535 [Streptomyces sp. ADI97-07]
MLTVSPDTRAWRAVASPPATTWPVLTPIRVASRMPSVECSSSLRRARAFRIPRAAARARRASSSRTTGTPKTAITASPMNFSGVPPRATISALIASKYRSVTVRRVSGSSTPDSAVEPTRSQKSTVTGLRSSSAGATATAHGVPQEKQNRASGGSS